MRLTTLIFLLMFATAVHAAPTIGGDDAGAAYRPNRGLLTRLGDLTDRVEAGASELVANAMGLLGVPYKRGGTSEATGFDCSGFVRKIYEQTAGLLLPRSASQQAAATEKIDRTDLQPGDLVFFNTMRRAFSHVGIYVGDGKFIHAPKPGAEVRVEDMGQSYWTRRFDGARRVVLDATIGTKAETTATQPAAQAPSGP